jgi:hypothetical protein
VNKEEADDSLAPNSDDWNMVLVFALLLVFVVSLCHIFLSFPFIITINVQTLVVPTVPPVPDKAL